MKYIHLENLWIVKALVEDIFNSVTDFNHIPKNLPKVTERVTITKREDNDLEIDTQVKSSVSIFPVKMKTTILPQSGFTSDNQRPKFGTSGQERLILEKVEDGTKINYVYEVDVHKKWLRIIANPLIGWFAIKV